MNNKHNILDRREFLKLGVLTTTAAIATSCSLNAQEQKAKSNNAQDIAPATAVVRQDSSRPSEY